MKSIVGSINGKMKFIEKKFTCGTNNTLAKFY